VKQVLAAIDFSEATSEVLRCAAELTEAFEATLILVHVAAPNPEFVGYEAGPSSVRDSRARELRREHRMLQEYAEDLRQRGIPTKALLVQGPTVQTLLDEARSLRADVIVIGSRGHGAVRRVLLGSVSRGVLGGALCPVHWVPIRAAAPLGQAKGVA